MRGRGWRLCHASHSVKKSKYTQKWTAQVACKSGALSASESSGTIQPGESELPVTLTFAPRTTGRSEGELHVTVGQAEATWTLVGVVRKRPARRRTSAVNEPWRTARLLLVTLGSVSAAESQIGMGF
jgi:hypothetical protein